MARARDASVAPTASRSQRRRMWDTFVGNRAAVIGLALAVVITLLSIFAPLIASQDPLAQNGAARLTPPDDVYRLGRDAFGRDVLARILYAGRVSLVIGIASVALGGTIGTLIGLVAGYSGGKLEGLLMRAVDVLMAFPSLLLGLTVLAVLGPGLEKVILAIGLLLSPPFARVVHGATLSLKEQEFLSAARAVGAGHIRLMRVHILPNMVGEIAVLVSVLTASAIRVEASLSFIGLGISPPTPTWGNMIRDGTTHLINAPWLSVFPGLAILLTVLAFNLLGDGLRDVLDPKLQR
ncbi:MAG TPA: ABC transporter permease [Candidatus Limnocylindria bacterium]